MSEADSGVFSEPTLTANVSLHDSPPSGALFPGNAAPAAESSSHNSQKLVHPLGSSPGSDCGSDPLPDYSQEENTLRLEDICAPQSRMRYLTLNTDNDIENLTMAGIS